MRLILACLLVLLASCKERVYTWEGIPPAHSCAWDHDGNIGTCISGGRAYQCINPHLSFHVTCALVSPITPAEMPK